MRSPEGILWFLAAVLLLAARIVPPWTQPLGDPDFWWLWWHGTEWLHGTMPVLNSLSWTASDAPWVTHEPGVALIDALAGPDHLGIVRNLLLAVTWLVLTYGAWRPGSGRSLPLTLAWAMLLVNWGVSERPLSWGNLMMAVTVALTTPARRLDGRPTLLGGSAGRDSARLALAALGVGLWANLHGSFPVGIVLVGLADWRWGIAAALATLANPYGLHIWGLLGEYQPGADVGMFVEKAIPEWQPLDLTTFPGLLAGALLLIALPLVWPFRWRPVLLWAALTAMAFRHARFTDIAAIGLLPWVSAGLSLRLAPLSVPSPLGPATAVTVLAAVLLTPPRFLPAEYPPDFPFRQLIGHRVWNEYGLGGFLGAHGVPVFWDPRVHCYPLPILVDGSRIEWSDAQRGPLLEQWKVDRVVARSAHILDPLRDAGWRDEGGAGNIRILARP